MKTAMNTEMEQHLKETLLPFWEGLRDTAYGGYYGFVGTDLKTVPESEKGCILNSRILWFFSNAYLALKDESIRPYAEHAYRFLIEHCMDEKEGGVFWSVSYDGTPLDTTKHTYNQAFAIYALSSYYDAFHEEEALKAAFELFRLIELKCRDEVGYKEAQSREFFAVSNEKLSENGVMADRTMNTLLHVFEAYTELYRVSRRQETAERLKWMLDTIAGKIFNPEKKRQEVFFDNQMNSLIDLHSYGHDIETAWLIDRGTKILGDEIYIKKMRPITRALEDIVYQTAYTNHSLANECECGTLNELRIWWVQAEAVVGFYNAWQKRPQEIKFKEASEDIWKFIKEHVIDHRDGGEWFWCTDKDGMPDTNRPVVEPWKCPYHNGRMCMEIMRRMAE